MTSKERAKLKSIAAKEDTILQIGKNPLGDAFIKQVTDALKARELIKIRVLETCEMLPLEAAQAISDKVGCEIVQVIGSRIVLFQKRPKTDKKPSLLDEAKEQNLQNRRGKTAAKSTVGAKGKKPPYKQKEASPKPYTPRQTRIRSIGKNSKNKKGN